MPLNTFIGAALLVACTVRLVFLFIWLRHLYGIIREKRPDEWVAHNGSGYVHRYAWTGRLILGTVKLDIPGRDYRRYLSTARLHLGYSVVLFLAGLVAIAWPA